MFNTEWDWILYKVWGWLDREKNLENVLIFELGEIDFIEVKDNFWKISDYLSLKVDVEFKIHVEMEVGYRLCGIILPWIFLFESIIQYDVSEMDDDIVNGGLKRDINNSNNKSWSFSIQMNTFYSNFSFL